ncbi:hypothetical protein SAMN05445060_2752 [Williamsia sterculiae]|uniref:Uncharacterized protein n=1 Tax=Williamsia sterculiae TaxID=1344003 RepID=A0A1N7GGD5_9NOCA|nr:hypothetical protein SAMN05445060_2752 [Williamsia sterculiae]
MMGSSNDKLNLTGRVYQIDQTPMPISPLARAAELREYAKEHKSAKIDYTVPKHRKKRYGVGGGELEPSQVTPPQEQ